jgi:D-psicose/D-tagatose/L-ribulose 3-epimerase
MRMKFGINTLAWVSPFDSANLDVIYKAADLGFDTIEIAVEDVSLIDAAKIKIALKDTSLNCLVSGAFGPDRDIIHEDLAVRRNAKEYIEYCIDLAQELESDLVSGPAYSSVGKARYIPAEQKKKEWDLCRDSFKGLTRRAQEGGVRIALEPLNRFETDFINLAKDAVRFAEEVGEPGIGVHLDTFHMNIEEKDICDAIVSTGKRLFHFHASENDRGTVGSGHVPWKDVAEALKRAGYDRYVVVETFVPGVKEIAKAASIWRQLEKDQDTLAQKSLDFLRSTFV